MSATFVQRVASTSYSASRVGTLHHRGGGRQGSRRAAVAALGTPGGVAEAEEGIAAGTAGGDDGRPSQGRRAALAGMAAAAAASVAAPPAARAAAVKLTSSGLDPSRRFFLTFPPVWEPYFGWGERVTVRRELVPGQIWSLEQEQALDVLAMNIRCTVVKLKSGGLVVFSPQVRFPHTPRTH